MTFLHGIFGGSVAAAILAGATAPASAQNAIGEMAQIQGSVTGTFGGRTAALANGSSVVQDETVATAAQSTGRVAFHDLTSLAIGPNASVKLDRYIYNGQGTVTSSTLKLMRGAFRLVSGRSPSQNIGVQTVTATIGLRGTVVDVLVRPGREIVWLREGATTVCRGSQCMPIDVPGTGVIITPSGISAPSTEAAREFDFDVLSYHRFPLYQPYLGSPRGGDTQGDTQDSHSGSNANGPN